MWDRVVAQISHSASHSADHFERWLRSRRGGIATVDVMKRVGGPCRRLVHGALAFGSKHVAVALRYHWQRPCIARSRLIRVKGSRAGYKRAQGRVLRAPAWPNGLRSRNAWVRSERCPRRCGERLQIQDRLVLQLGLAGRQLRKVCGRMHVRISRRGRQHRQGHTAAHLAPWIRELRPNWLRRLVVDPWRAIRHVHRADVRGFRHSVVAPRRDAALLSLQLPCGVPCDADARHGHNQGWSRGMWDTA